MGLYSGEKRELECDFVFSTIQTISKSAHLENFSKDHFDYISLMKRIDLAQILTCD
jgi:superfamily II DNA or RNA helicase